jgi:hypothetical protein
MADLRPKICGSRREEGGLTHWNPVAEVNAEIAQKPAEVAEIGGGKLLKCWRRYTSAADLEPSMPEDRPTL